LRRTTVPGADGTLSGFPGSRGLKALSHLAHLSGKEEVARDLTRDFDRQEPLLDEAFWSPDKQIFAYAEDLNGKRVDVASVLATVPMWFRQLNEGHAHKMIDVLAGPDHQADWGMRILSSSDSKYDPGGYHFGTVGRCSLVGHRLRSTAIIVPFLLIQICVPTRCSR